MDAINETVRIILTIIPSLKQFDPELHVLNERRPLDSDGYPILVNSSESESETKESEIEEVDENDEQIQKCLVYNLDYRSPNAQMIKEIKKAKEIMKKTLETNRFLKPDFLTSGLVCNGSNSILDLNCWENAEELVRQGYEC
eukprot:CAMPEP_0119038734 /NCGR_PEP_ID=MMETSP1177-20130426/7829_1 /TAXON_ID=2985 /ORGANISM="Ochromonas sp, Strain CCMP1899" /LENGTH=141 /DNA_ID=CAMNT_0007001707 /DNA_START=215 /DNA_END=640 /DNA_ORIENTATION=+